MEGVSRCFIGDGSYLFVLDNPNYEGSAKMLFDESNHPLSKKDFARLTDEQKARCQWRRCYKMVTLLHTNRSLDFFLFIGVKILPGNAHECPVLYELVDPFVDTVGKEVMKRVILDRGFLDGAAITRRKRDQQIDVLIPVKRNMDIYADAAALFEQPNIHWVEWTAPAPAPAPKKPPRPRPKAVAKRERKRRKTIQERKEQEPSPPPEKTLVKTEVAATIGGFRSWSSCKVPLTVVCNREQYGDGHTEKWYLLDTQRVQNPKKPREDYRLRTATEERYRQYKCFNNLTDFTSRAISLVVNQVVFIMLAVNLLQYYLLRQARTNNARTNNPRDRVLVTPLRPGRASELELRYSRGSYYRPYREHDELRVASCTLTHKSSGRSLDLGALLVRRDHRESDTVLLTTGLDQGLSGRELADLYFRRWPVQENAFKEGAAALQLDKHRGNCGRMVANVAVITKLERITARIEQARAALAKLRTEQEALAEVIRETGRADRKAQSKLATRRRRLDALIESGKTSGAGFAKAALEHQQALVDAEATAAAAHKANTTNADARARADKLTKQTDALVEQQAHLEPQRKIRQLDVAQDQVLTATKLTANQLISFALRKYLKGHPMTPETFASRVFVVHGRKEIEPERERIVFYENPRDPEVTGVAPSFGQRSASAKYEVGASDGFVRGPSAPGSNPIPLIGIGVRSPDWPPARRAPPRG